METPPFAFSRLPLVARRVVILCMHPGAIYSLYWASQKMREMVKSMKIRANDLEWNFSMIGKNVCGGHNPHVAMTFPCGRVFKMSVVAVEVEDVWKPNVVIKPWVTVETLRVFPRWTKEEEPDWSIRPVNPDILSMNRETLESATRALLECFHTDAFSVRSKGLLNLSLVSSVFLKYSKTFKTIRASSQGQISDRLPFGHHQMRLLLHNVAADELEVEGVDENLHFNGVIRNRILKTDGSWLTLNNVLKMKCAVLEVSQSDFSATELNVILKEWCKGGKTLMRLERMEIQCMDVIEPDALLDGVKTIDDDSPMRQERCVRIWRPDGRTANVSVDEQLLQFTLVN